MKRLISIVLLLIVVFAQGAHIANLANDNRELRAQVSDLEADLDSCQDVVVDNLD